jgi:hypothetical protein
MSKRRWPQDQDDDEEKDLESKYVNKKIHHLNLLTIDRKSLLVPLRGSDYPDRAGTDGGPPGYCCNDDSSVTWPRGFSRPTVKLTKAQTRERTVYRKWMQKRWTKVLRPAVNALQKTFSFIHISMDTYACSMRAYYSEQRLSTALCSLITKTFQEYIARCLAPHPGLAEELGANGFRCECGSWRILFYINGTQEAIDYDEYMLRVRGMWTKIHELESNGDFVKPP